MGLSGGIKICSIIFEPLPGRWRVFEVSRKTDGRYEKGLSFAIERVRMTFQCSFDSLQQ